MENHDFLEDEIDWNCLLTELTDPSAAEFFSNPSPNGSVSSKMGEIESVLMNDNDNDVDLETNQQSLDDFFADIFVGPSSSPSPASGAEVIELPTDKDGNCSNESGNVCLVEEKAVDQPEVNKSDNNNDSANNDDADDPVSKKQRRQLRNRDAAVRSRERKKMYVKDLELKSRYLEGECRKLGRLLQCVLAENHALRFGLLKGNANGASSAKQESAVLLLESLLLGSLLWFLGIMCIFTLPKLIQSNLESVPRFQVEEKASGNLAQRETGSEGSVSVVKSRRCIASRTKMKKICHFLFVVGL